MMGWIVSQEKHTFYALLTWTHNGKNTFYLLFSLLCVHWGPPLMRTKQLAMFVFCFSIRCYRVLGGETSSESSCNFGVQHMKMSG